MVSRDSWRVKEVRHESIEYAQGRVAREGLIERSMGHLEISEVRGLK
jgi:hypothetical protein